MAKKPATPVTSNSVPATLTQRDYFNLTLETMLRNEPKKIEKFAEELKKDPAYAFDWSLEAMEAAAKLKVAKQVKASFDSGTSIEDLFKYATHETVRGARYVRQSSSPVSNVMHQFTTAAWATIAEFLEQTLGMRA